MRRGALIAALCWASVATALAGSSVPDISLGVALPSLGGAILENPAGLADGAGAEFDLGVDPTSVSSNPEVYGSYAGSKGSFGFGIEILKMPLSFIGAAALGAKLGSLELGVNMVTPLSGFQPNFGAGLRVELGRARLGLYSPDVTAPWRMWTLGVGVQGGNNLNFEVDGIFRSDGTNPAPTSATVVPAVELSMSKKLAIKVSYGIMVMPTINTSSPGLGAGIQYWFGSKWAAFFLYNSGTYPYTLGLNFAM